MSAITTHVLDTSRGQPADGIHVVLRIESADGSWKQIGAGTTDADGRARDLLPSNFALHSGVYELTFDTASYFASKKVETFYRKVSVVFEIHDPAQHYHVPLLLSPFGYSTYRGS
jgi:5-hydroxyisourate hydrolase